MSWKDAYGSRRGDDEEYDPIRDEREALAKQNAIDKKCYSPDPLTQYLNRKRYYDRKRYYEERRAGGKRG